MVLEKDGLSVLWEGPSCIPTACKLIQMLRCCISLCKSHQALLNGSFLSFQRTQPSRFNPSVKRVEGRPPPPRHSAHSCFASKWGFALSRAPMPPNLLRLKTCAAARFTESREWQKNNSSHSQIKSCLNVCVSHLRLRQKAWWKEKSQELIVRHSLCRTGTSSLAQRVLIPTAVMHLKSKCFLK